MLVWGGVCRILDGWWVFGVDKVICLGPIRMSAFDTYRSVLSILALHDKGEAGEPVLLFIYLFVCLIYLFFISVSA